MPTGRGRALTGSDVLTGLFDHAARPEVSSLRRLSETLGAAEDAGAVAIAGAQWIATVLGRGTPVSLAGPDRSSHLRITWTSGPITGLSENAERRRVADRRAAFASLQPMTVRLEDREQILVMLPLTCRGRAVGILEVVAPEARLEAAWDVLEAGTSQLGAALHVVTQNERFRQEVETWERTSNLGATLVRARSADEAVRIAVRFVWERFRVPVAGWCEADGGIQALIETRGLANGGRRELRQLLATIPPWGSLGASEQETAKRVFLDIAGVHHVSALDARDGVLLVGHTDEAIDGSIEMVGSLLAEVLQILDAAALATMRNRHIDLGIAWTAHELRGPLLGVKAALELLLMRRTSDPAEDAVLRTSLSELDQLTSSADAILTWVVGEQPLRRGAADLIRVVEEAADSCRLEFGQDRSIAIAAPKGVIVPVEATHLRMVVSNLLRNALIYSFRGTRVEVVVQDAGDHVELSVRDEGPEIPAKDRRRIFDPFARGSNGRSNRMGTGLGLFIARRVVEAHGGRIWVESDPGWTTFYVRFPIEGRNQRRFAS
jgi:signal transduction histidine kinase